MNQYPDASTDAVLFFDSCAIQFDDCDRQLNCLTRKEIFCIHRLKFKAIALYPKKFAYLLSKLQRSKGFSNVWHVDEKFVRVKGSKDKFAYLWVVIDDKNNIIATYVSNNRDIISAKTVLQKAKQNAERPPDIIVTDGL